MSLLQMSFCGTVMILAVALIRAVLIDRLPKRTFLVLWGIVMLRLLVPFEIPSAFSVYSLAGHDSVKGFVEAPAEGNQWFDAVQNILKARKGEEQKNALETGEGNASQHFAVSGNGTVVRYEVSGVKMEELDEWIDGSVAIKNTSEEKEKQPDMWNANGIARVLYVIGDKVSSNYLLVLWGIGALFCTAFFLMTYVRCRREFSMSLPACNEFVAQWMEERLAQERRFFHGFCQKAQVRVSDRVDTPLTYGVFQPVILLPKKLEGEESEQLEYILWHEYMHIYHCDTVMKLLTVFVCCIHWFNPFVWLMYVLLNRDVELACDESVVRRKGVSGKSVYANILIDMEAERNRLRPLCSNFSLNAIEKRIRSIMVIRRFSIGAVAVAAGLVMSVTVVFATSAVPEAEKNGASNADFTAEEYGMLNALRFDGYEDMSVAGYRDRVLAVASTDEYREMLGRFFMDEKLYDMRGKDELSTFVFYALRPLTAQWWTESYFYGCILPEDIALPQKEMQGLGYGISLYVSNADDLSVGEYVDTVCGMTEGLSKVMDGKSEEELADEAYMTDEIQQAVELLQKEWSNYKLRAGVEFEYKPIDGREEAQPEREIEKWKRRYSDEMMYYVPTARENSGYEPGTEEDYRKILLLRQPGYSYEKMSVEEFDRILQGWSVKNYESYDRIMNDILLDDFQVELSEEEKRFITHTINIAATSNSAMSNGSNFEGLEQGILLNLFFDKNSAVNRSAYVWDNMNCHVSYYVTDKDTVTVGERDRCIGGMMDEVERLWKEMDAGAVLEMKRGDFQSKMVNLTKKYSSKEITLWSMGSNYYLGWWMI